MKTSDVINKRIHDLPEPLQREVLDFVEYLANKAGKEDSDWSLFSLASAMRGLEGENWPDYAEGDLKEKWK